MHSPTPTASIPTEVARLQRITDYPAVTLICPTAPLEPDLTRRLHALANHARRRLAREFGDDDPLVAVMMTRLRTEIDRVRPVDAPTVALFVSPTTTSWLPIAEPAPERVVIDDTFATRDLVHAAGRGTRTWVLHLASAPALFHGLGHRFTPEPLSSPDPPVPTLERHPDRDRRGRQDASALRDRRLVRAVRVVDTLISPTLEASPAPLLVIGSERRLAAFARHSQMRASIAGTVPWGGRTLTSQGIAELTFDLVEELIASEGRQALRAVDQAIKAGRLATGLDGCWSKAMLGLAEVTVVEQGYSVAGRPDPTTGNLQRCDDPEAPGVVDDLVDDLIEIVLAHRGRVTFVPDGTLTERGLDRIVVCGRA